MVDSRRSGGRSTARCSTRSHPASSSPARRRAGRIPRSSPRQRGKLPPGWSRGHCPGGRSSYSWLDVRMIPQDSEGPVMPTVNVRYMVDDVDAAVAFYTAQLGFKLISKTLPAFADVALGDLRLLLSGPASSAGRPMPDGRRPTPGGWNRIHLIVNDLEAEVARLRNAGVRFRNDIVTGPGGSQTLLEDPSGNPIELFLPRRTA